jgi:hypothetical protein
VSAMSASDPPPEEEEGMEEGGGPGESTIALMAISSFTPVTREEGMSEWIDGRESGWQGR